MRFSGSILLLFLSAGVCTTLAQQQDTPIARRLTLRHHLIERMLTEMFGMEWYKVHDEAEQLEHAVSADFERKLLDRLGTGEACPHGNRVERDTPQDRRNQYTANAFFRPVRELGATYFDASFDYIQNRNSTLTSGRLGASFQASEVRILPSVRWQHDNTFGADQTQTFYGVNTFVLPQPWLGRVVADANAAQDDYRFEVTSLAEYSAAAAAPPRVEGTHTLAELRVPEALRKETMGHKEIRTTQIYTHLWPMNQVEPLAQLSAATPLSDLFRNEAPAPAATDGKPGAHTKRVPSPTQSR